MTERLAVAAMFFVIYIVAIIVCSAVLHVTPGEASAYLALGGVIAVLSERRAK